nr:hypothetical protein [uncultured Roseococcus sp.]
MIGGILSWLLKLIRTTSVPPAADIPPPTADLLGSSTLPPAASGPRGTKGVQSRAWRNRNPGNMRLRTTKEPVDHVTVDNDPGGPFGIYGSERDGWADLAARILQLWRGGTRSVRGIISIWAPPSDGNNTNAYIAGVAKALGVSPDQEIDPRPMATMTVLADAIRRHEGLPNDPAWDTAQRDAGFRLAGCT